MLAGRVLAMCVHSKTPILRAHCLIKLPGLTTPTTWASFKTGGVGCTVCNAAGFVGSSRGNYGRFSGGPTSLNLYRLWRHGQGPQHCQALKMLGGKAISRTRKAPSTEALKSTWQAIRKGSAILKKQKRPSGRVCFGRVDSAVAQRVPW